MQNDQSKVTDPTDIVGMFAEGTDPAVTVSALCAVARLALPLAAYRDVARAAIDAAEALVCGDGTPAAACTADAAAAAVAGDTYGAAGAARAALGNTIYSLIDTGYKGVST